MDDIIEIYEHAWPPRGRPRFIQCACNPGCACTPTCRHSYRESDMPLTKKGQKIKSAMKKEYGAKKGERVFYASINKGTVKGAEKRRGK